MEQHEEIIVVGCVMINIIRIVVIHVHYVRREINVHDELKQHVDVDIIVQREVQLVLR